MPVGYSKMAGVERLYVGPYGHMDSGNHKERNVAHGVLSSYLPKIPCLYISKYLRTSFKYARFWWVSTDGLDEARIQRKKNLLPMRTKEVDWLTTGVRLLP